MADQKPFGRRPENGMVAGVAAGLAEKYDIDVTLVRLAMVALAVVSAGAAVVGYALAAVAMPRAEDAPGITSVKHGVSDLVARGKTLYGEGRKVVEKRAGGAPASSYADDTVTSEPFGAPQASRTPSRADNAMATERETDSPSPAPADTSAAQTADRTPATSAPPAVSRSESPSDQGGAAASGAGQATSLSGASSRSSTTGASGASAAGGNPAGASQPGTSRTPPPSPKSAADTIARADAPSGAITDGDPAAGPPKAPPAGA